MSRRIALLAVAVATAAVGGFHAAPANAACVLVVVEAGVADAGVRTCARGDSVACAGHVGEIEFTCLF